MRTLAGRLAESTIATAGLALTLGLLLGLGVAAGSPLYVGAALAGGVAAGVMLTNVRASVLGLLAVLFLLPFAVVPLPIGGVRPTFLDAALGVLLVAWLSQALLRDGGRFVATPLNGLVLAFVGLSFVALIAGLSHGLSPESFRLFLKLVNSVLLFFGIVNGLRSQEDLIVVTRVLLVLGASAAIIGIGLYLLPRERAVQALSMLGLLGYPTGPGVLRFLADTDRLRATGTAIDPNVFGATLALVAGVTFGQIFGRARVFPLWVLVAILAVTLPALALSLSRAAWLGCAAAAAFVGGLRDRRIWLALAALPLVLLLGAGDGADQYFGHLLSGFAARDRAAAMRLDEYREALRIISDYPLFGVGFGSAPSVDSFVGVSSVYLQMAEYMGLSGLAVFAAIVVRFYRDALPLLWPHASTHRPDLGGDGRRTIGEPGANASVSTGPVAVESESISPQVDEVRRAIALSALAAVTAALVTGLLDHHFFSLRFPHVAALFWLHVGLATAALRRGGSQVQP
ncbi:MAG: O-antigen ligase family protein [Chloroflexi bacterium]|nr:O-antigen ligase family protein [Chloroflexota bacterium]